MSRAPKSPARALPDRARLAAALDALAETDRLVLSLHLLEGMSALEIAGTLRLRAREVEQRRRAALTAIARELGAGAARRAGSARRRVA